MEPSFTQPGNCIVRFPSVRWMKTHCSIIFQPVLWGVIKELYRLLQKWSLNNDMLQQGELRVVGCEKEDPTWVHLDSKEGWVEWMHLCIQWRPMKAAWFCALLFDPRFGGQNCLSCGGSLERGWKLQVQRRSNLSRERLPPAAR